ncbi:MAG: M3 family oligoendopeptidase [Clostridia bacterium]|nr:M3 family oligoendopeptidase [Clostridia bacterium]
MDNFHDIPYKRPDIKKLKEAIKQCIKDVKNAKSAEDLIAALEKNENATKEMETYYVIASIRNTMDTTDEFYDGEMQYFNRTVPALMPISKKMTDTLLASPYIGAIEEKYGVQVINLLKAAAAIQSKKLVPSLIKEGLISTQYSKTVASCTTDFNGEQCNFYGLLRHMGSTDREVRKSAFIAWADMYKSISDKLDKQYDSLVALRHKMAKKLGYDTYTPLAYLQRSRFDYTAQDVAAFREQVRTVITPLVAKMRQKQAERIGVDKLHYYDEEFMFPDGNAMPIGDKDSMLAAAEEMYSQLSAETGEFFSFMTKHNLFDLETRPGKHMGGYCTFLSLYKAPFIFSNFNGTSADVDVLTHEAGHAFEAYTASRIQPISDYYSSTSEINEIHSMAMELFTHPWMDKFFGENADKYRFAHLSGCISVIPYLTCVDEFQHGVYADPNMTAKERRTLWRSIEQKYMPWRDYDGNEFLDEGGFWMQKQHIFLYPFYYIDYALAQLGALELYNRMQKDRDEAWESYLELCRAGGSKPYLELLKLAKLSNPFKEGTVASILAPLEDILLSR